MKDKKRIHILLGIGLGILFSILFIISVVKVVPEIFEPDYTIQDIHLWCCRHLNETLSPTGENCSNVINNIYGDTC